MALLSEPRKKSIMDFLLKKIPEADFLQEFAPGPGDAQSQTLRLLQDALARQDPVGAQYGLLLMHRFGFTPAFLPVLHALAEAPWLTAHENAISALAKLKDPSSVAVLERTAVAEHAYKAWDKARALNTKSIYGLADIATPEAVAALAGLAGHKDRAIKSTAKELLRDLARNGGTEEAKSLAESFLKRKA